MPLIAVIIACFASLFLYSAAVYWLLHDALGMQHVFAGLYRMFMYHAAHPYQYIALFCAVYALVLALVLQLFPQMASKRRWAVLACTLLLTLLLASAMGGVLWKVHDMQAGYFTEGARLWRDLLWGAENGVQVGWQVLALSQPFGLLCLPGFVVVTVQCCKRARKAHR